MGILQNLKEKFSLKKIQTSIAPEQMKTEEQGLKFRVGTTSGLYGVARGEELADIISKVSYTLTRGAAVLELASDVPHEVNYTQGKEIRYIAERQDVDITFHGSLTVQMAIPEIIEWSTAQEHLQKSIKSAVHAGAKYIDFHSCLREWLELFTYAGSRLHIIMSDHEGNFIGEVFRNNEKLANWFVNESRYRFWSAFGGVIVGQELNLKLETAMDQEMDRIIDDNFGKIKDALVERSFNEVIRVIAADISRELNKPIEEVLRLTPEEVKATKAYSDYFQSFINDLKRDPYHSKINLLNRLRILGERTDEIIRRRIEKKRERTIKTAVFDKLTQKGDWYEKERTGATLEMAYYIIAHQLYIHNDDKIWKDMVELYLDDLEKLGYQPYDETKDRIDDGWDESIDEAAREERRLNWLERTLRDIERNPDKELIKTFKEFYYGVVAAKFLQGHLEKLVDWMERELKDVIKKEVEITEPDKGRIKEQQEKLLKALDGLCIAIENPDARDPSQGGRFLLWRPRQIYLAIKHTRNNLKGDGEPKYKHWDKIFMLIDFEHLATQGVDPLQELTELKNNPLTSDFGRYVKTVHSGVPTPLHSHKPIGPEDREIIYRLLWLLKEAGLGKDHLTYLIFERGGFKDPFAGSVRALKAMAELMRENVPPDKLPESFFVIPKEQDAARQKVIIFEHTFDPIKGMLKFPEEEYTLLGASALKAGKRPEEWKKEELR